MLMKQLELVSVYYIRRSSNVILIAHKLVGLSRSIGSKTWMGSLPHQLQADLLTVYCSWSKEVYDASIQMGSAMISRGVNPVSCGIYGANCPEWIIAMEACNSSIVTYVPLYDTLCPNDVEFIINHAEVSIAFVQENKIPPVKQKLIEVKMTSNNISNEESSKEKKSIVELPLVVALNEYFLPCLIKNIAAHPWHDLEIETIIGVTQCFSFSSMQDQLCG